MLSTLSSKRLQQDGENVYSRTLPNLSKVPVYKVESA